MRAVLLVLLSALAVLPASGATGELLKTANRISVSDEPCCEEEAAEGEVSHPCAPGESCPPSGGCCACVSCCKRVANAPANLRPEGGEDTRASAVPAEGHPGIEEVGAVWHPPRG